MKLWLHTWRYGIETELEYHGKQWLFDPVNRILEIVEPILKDGSIAKWQVVTVLDGEQFTVKVCGSDCELHAYADDGKRLVRVAPESDHVISSSGS